MLGYFEYWPHSSSKALANMLTVFSRSVVLVILIVSVELST